MKKALFWLLTVGTTAFLVSACAAQQVASSLESQPESSISSSLPDSAGKTAESKALETESASRSVSSSGPKAGASASDKGAPSSSRAQQEASSSTPIPVAPKPVARPWSFAFALAVPGSFMIRPTSGLSVLIATSYKPTAAISAMCSRALIFWL